MLIFLYYLRFCVGESFFFFFLFSLFYSTNYDLVIVYQFEFVERQEQNPH